MEIIISHKSALEYWRLNSSAKINDVARLRRKHPPLSLPSFAITHEVAPSGLSHPINLMVGNKNAQWKSKTTKARVHTGPAPDGCFISIGDELLVSAPPFCFLQMAGELPLIKLIELGFELCGSYSLPIKNEYSPGVEMKAVDEIVYNHPQLTRIKALKSFTAHMGGVNGYKKAQRALRYIADGSGSPMETILFMLLTLPYKLGGYGLPMPELNRRIDMPSTAKPKRNKPYYVCDFYWPEGGLAIEYDSDFYHTGADRIARDSKKRFDLATRGITVITVTSRQIRNAVEFENLVTLIAGKLKKRLRHRDSQFQKARRELRNQLL